MNEDERGITPANVTAMTVERDGDLWWVIIEQGNGDVLKDIKLTDLERLQLAMMLETVGQFSGEPMHLDFIDVSRAERRPD